MFLCFCVHVCFHSSNPNHRRTGQIQKYSDVKKDFDGLDNFRDYFSDKSDNKLTALDNADNDNEDDQNIDLNNRSSINFVVLDKSKTEHSNKRQGIQIKQLSRNSVNFPPSVKSFINNEDIRHSAGTNPRILVNANNTVRHDDDKPANTKQKQPSNPL